MDRGAFRTRNAVHRIIQAPIGNQGAINGNNHILVLNAQLPSWRFLQRGHHKDASIFGLPDLHADPDEIPLCVLLESPDLIGPNKSGVIVKTREGSVSDFLHQSRGWYLDRTGVGIQQLAHDFPGPPEIDAIVALDRSHQTVNCLFPERHLFRVAKARKVFNGGQTRKRRKLSGRPQSLHQQRPPAGSIHMGTHGAAHPQQQGNFGDSPGHFSPIKHGIGIELGKILPLPQRHRPIFSHVVELSWCVQTENLHLASKNSQALLVLVTEVSR